MTDTNPATLAYLDGLLDELIANGELNESTPINEKSAGLLINRGLLRRSEALLATQKSLSCRILTGATVKYLKYKISRLERMPD